MTVTDPTPATTEDAHEGRTHDAGPAVPVDEEAELVDDDVLVEEISIDGMCGVY